MEITDNLLRVILMIFGIYERRSEKRVLNAFQLLLRNRHLKNAQNEKNNMLLKYHKNGSIAWCNKSILCF